jgi:hypothetical protein
MAISADRTSREHNKFLESTATANQVGVVVVNPDGTNIGSAAGSSAITSVIPGTGATNLGKAEDAAHTTADVGVMALAVRRDTAAASGADGDYVTINSDASGALWVRGLTAISSSVDAVSIDQSTALEASTVTKASAGRIFGITGRIDTSAGTGAYYIQVLNHASLPADGAVTFLMAPIKKNHTNGTDTFFDIDLTGLGGVYASTGIVVCLSYTEFTKTITSAYLATTVFYA